MNKGLKYTLIVLGSILVLYQTAKMTNILALYRSPAGSSFPTLKSGERFWASRLKSPKRFSLVCFKWKDSMQGSHLRVYRLCGIEGDKIEIRDGVLYINEVNVDVRLSLAHNYLMKTEDAQKLIELKEIEEEGWNSYSPDSVMATVPDEAIRKYSISAQKVITAKNFLNTYISKTFQADWNDDHFGPLIVPKSKYFVLGDNRSAAEDSRYIGFIDKSSVVATVIGK